jgi:serine/threonine protein kinase
LAGLKLRSDGDEVHELVPSMPSQFASPEQLENQPVDFRSDIFSLGAAMWFLLTGAAPPAAAESGPRLSPSAVAVPRFVRNLVSQMLRTNPEERPQDPAAFAERIHACLQKAERRTAFTRSFGPPAITTIPIPEKKRVAPALALAAAIAILASLSAFYFVRSQRESKPLGVIIGVPETVEASSLPVAASSPPSPVINQAAEQSGLVAQQSPTQTASPPTTSVAADKLSSSPQLAANNRMAEPPVPAEGPSETSQAPISAEPPPAGKSESPAGDLPDRTATAAKGSVPAVAAAGEPPNSPDRVASTRKRDDASVSKTKARRHRVAKSARPLPPLRVGSESARVVGTTPNGDLVLRLPSGETIVTPPVPDLEDAPVIYHRRVRRVLRPIPLEDEPPVIVLPPNF